MKKILFLLLFPTLVFAQDGAFRYFTSFNNKANTDYSINTPEQYLSFSKSSIFFIALCFSNIVH